MAKLDDKLLTGLILRSKKKHVFPLLFVYIDLIFSSLSADMLTLLTCSVEYCFDCIWMVDNNSRVKWRRPGLHSLLIVLIYVIPVVEHSPGAVKKLWSRIYYFITYNLNVFYLNTVDIDFAGFYSPPLKRNKTCTLKGPQYKRISSCGVHFGFLQRIAEYFGHLA